MSHTVAVLPVKRFGAAKRRLGGRELSPGARRMLAEAMVTDVLIALRRCPAVDLTYVVTGEPTAEALAGGYDAQVVHDPEDRSHSDAAMLGVAAAVRAGAERVLLVPGDCPAIVPADITAVLAQAGTGPEVLIVPDRHGTGTNALVITPPDAIDPAFGPGSCERHERLAAAAGVTSRIVEIPAFALDVDTVEDLAALRETLEAARGGAANTRGLLARFDRQ